MLNRVAQKLSASLYYKDYISSEEFDWCTYVIEKLILRTAFLTFTFAWVLLTSSLIATLVSISVFCLLRSKTGGYHAKCAAVCLVLSSLLVISCEPAVNALIKLPHAAFWTMNVVIILFGYFIRPVYPAEAEISDADATANSKAKRAIIIFILSAQVLTELINIRTVSVSLFYGVMMAMTSILITKTGRKKVQ